MTMIFRIKRRLVGSPGAPSSLKGGELAFNQVDDTLYLGHGDDGTGTALTIRAIGGSGAFLTLDTSQTVSGPKTFTGPITLASTALAVSPALTDNSTRIVTTEWVRAQGYLLASQVPAVAPSLTALSLLTGQAGTMPVFTGPGAMTLATFTTFGQTLIAAVGPSTALGLLGLGSLASQDAGSVAITGGRISGVTLDGLTLDAGTF